MGESVSAETAIVKVGHSLPALDFAPFFVAHALGYFKDEGLTVSTVFDADRQRPIREFLAGELDCLLTGPLRTFDLEHRGIHAGFRHTVVGKTPAGSFGLGKGNLKFQGGRNFRKPKEIF